MRPDGDACDLPEERSYATRLQLHSRPNLTPRVFDTVHVAWKRIPDCRPIFLVNWRFVSVCLTVNTACPPRSNPLGDNGSPHGLQSGSGHIAGHRLFARAPVKGIPYQKRGIDCDSCRLQHRCRSSKRAMPAPSDAEGCGERWRLGWSAANGNCTSAALSESTLGPRSHSMGPGSD